MLKRITTMALLMPLLVGCAPTNISAPAGDVPPKPTHLKITHEQAQEMMREQDVIILDVRRMDEFLSGHIENAVLLPVEELEDRALDVLSDMDATILIYCRSGRRSADAARILSSLGFTHVYDFGGIIDWPGEVVV